MINRYLGISKLFLFAIFIIGDRSYCGIVPETAFNQQRLLESSCFQGNEEIKTVTTGSCTTYWRIWVPF